MKRVLVLLIICSLLSASVWAGQITFPADLPSEHSKIPKAHVTDGNSHDHAGNGGAFVAPTPNEKAALAGTNGTPSGTNKFVTNSDPRLSDSRTPTIHDHNYHTGIIGIWSQIDKTNSNISDLTLNHFTPDGSPQYNGPLHSSLTDIGTHTHFSIDNFINNSWAWNSYGNTSTINGWDSFWYKDIYLKNVGKTTFVSFYLHGVSNSTSASFTLPFPSKAPAFIHTMIQAADNSSWVPAGMLSLAQHQKTVNLYKDGTGADFTASGNKTVVGQFFYEPDKTVLLIPALYLLLLSDN